MDNYRDFLFISFWIFLSIVNNLVPCQKFIPGHRHPHTFKERNLGDSVLIVLFFIHIGVVSTFKPGTKLKFSSYKKKNDSRKQGPTVSENYIQYPMINHNGKEFLKIFISESLYWTAEINTTL